MTWRGTVMQELSETPAESCSRKYPRRRATAGKYPRRGNSKSTFGGGKPGGGNPVPRRGNSEWQLEKYPRRGQPCRMATRKVPSEGATVKVPSEGATVKVPSEGATGGGNRLPASCRSIKPKARGRNRSPWRGRAGSDPRCLWGRNRAPPSRLPREAAGPWRRRRSRPSRC
jgi:hypothetical protein